MQQDASEFTIGMLIFPRMTQLDFTGPFEVFARIPNAKVHVLWKQIEPIISDRGLAIMPTTTLDDCPNLDLICVPGGPGQIAMMDDEQIVTFVRNQGPTRKICYLRVYRSADSGSGGTPNWLQSNHPLDVTRSIGRIWSDSRHESDCRGSESYYWRRRHCRDRFWAFRC